ncbi:MAG: hypothetical protein IJ408_01575 [Clostridia bacterium]|nr:hypothetical protein [Clostridia bacterium]
MSEIVLLMEGFGNNIFITALSVIFPILIGILLTFIASKSKIAESVFSWLSMPFECICPALLLITVYYLIPYVFDLGINEIIKYVVIIVSFTTCFLFYMPARFVKSDSFLKNTLVNGIGLISAVFKWSFCLSFIGFLDLTRASQNIMAKYYNPLILLIPFAVSVLTLFVLELIKRFIKQFMK